MSPSPIPPRSLCRPPLFKRASKARVAKEAIKGSSTYRRSLSLAKAMFAHPLPLSLLRRVVIREITFSHKETTKVKAFPLGVRAKREGKSETLLETVFHSPMLPHFTMDLIPYPAGKFSSPGRVTRVCARLALLNRVQTLTCQLEINRTDGCGMLDVSVSRMLG